MIEYTHRKTGELVRASRIRSVERTGDVALVYVESEDPSARKWAVPSLASGFKLLGELRSNIATMLVIRPEYLVTGDRFVILAQEEFHQRYAPSAELAEIAARGPGPVDLVNPTEPMPSGKTGALRGRCGACDHLFVVAWLPMDMRRVVSLANNARCPACASQDIKVAES